MTVEVRKFLPRKSYCWPAEVYTAAADGTSFVLPHTGGYHTHYYTDNMAIINASNLMEVGGFFETERARGVIKADLRNASPVTAAAIKLMIADTSANGLDVNDVSNGGLYGQDPFVGDIVVHNFATSNTDQTPAQDFEATPLTPGGIHEFNAPPLVLGDVIEIDITSIYNAAVGGWLGLRLQNKVQGEQLERDAGAVVFRDVCIELEGVYTAPVVPSTRKLGFNLGQSNSDEWGNVWVDSGPTAIFYRNQTTGGSISHATGLPDGTGDTQVTIQTRVGQKYEAGDYVLDCPGNATFNGNSTPYTFTLTGGQTSQNFNVSGNVGAWFSLKKVGATGVYNTTATARLSRAVAVRDMDWGFTNETVVEYDAAHPYVRRRASGANERFIRTPTPETLAAMCMSHGVDLWHCFHHHATDDNIEEFVDRLVSAGYNRRLIVEWSNEVWNSFPQGIEIQNAGIATGLYAQAEVDYLPAQAQVAIRQAYYADESNRVAGICKARYANTVAVAASQTAIPNLFAYWQNYATTWPLPNVDVLSCSWYFGGPPTRLIDESTALAQTATSLAQIGLDDWRNRVRGLISTWKVNANSISKPLWFYEGGSHYWHASSTATDHYGSINRTAESAVVWAEAMDWIHDNMPDALAMVFEGVGDPTGAWTTIGPELEVGSPTWAEYLARI